MQLLPIWVLPPTLPSVYDSESFTALEMVSKLYGAVNELIKEYNETVEQLNGFKEDEKAAREEFELKITKVIKQFICDWEQQTADLESFAVTVINNAIQEGRITVGESYNPDTEELRIIVGGET